MGRMDAGPPTWIPPSAAIIEHGFWNCASTQRFMGALITRESTVVNIDKEITGPHPECLIPPSSGVGLRICISG